jgi:hypothetical protein
VRLKESVIGTVVSDLYCNTKCKNHHYKESLNINIWNRKSFERNLKFFDSEINKLPSDMNLRYYQIKRIADSFIQMEVDVKRFVDDKLCDDVFLLYVRALIYRMKKYDGSEKEVIDFFFKALEKYKTFSLMNVSKINYHNYDDFEKWDEALLWLRGSLHNNLKSIKRNLFDSYLFGLSAQSQEKVMFRFIEFYTTATQELYCVDYEFKRCRDNLAKLRPIGLTGEQAEIYDGRQRDALPKEEEE